MKKLTLLLVLIVALMSCEKDEPILQSEIVDFYNWNMIEVNEIVICNPIHFTRVESIEVAIFDDITPFGFRKYEFDLGGKIDYEYREITLTLEGDFFKSENFISTNQMRGQVYIKYY